jgi:hypothetical protein
MSKRIVQDSTRTSNCKRWLLNSYYSLIYMRDCRRVNGYFILCAMMSEEISINIRINEDIFAIAIYIILKQPFHSCTNRYSRIDLDWKDSKILNYCMFSSCRFFQATFIDGNIYWRLLFRSDSFVWIFNLFSFSIRKSATLFWLTCQSVRTETFLRVYYSCKTAI